MDDNTVSIDLNHTEITSKESLWVVLDLLDSLGMRYWVDGGWGVDMLIGRQTRTHRDVDIDFDATFEKPLLTALEAAGYRITTDWRPCRVELHHLERGYTDIHPLHISDSGSARQADPEGGWYHFKAEWFTTTVFEGRVIPCISAEAQRLLHSGYEPREVDKMDLANLDALASERKCL